MCCDRLEASLHDVQLVVAAHGTELTSDLLPRRSNASDAEHLQASSASNEFILDCDELITIDIDITHKRRSEDIVIGTEHEGTCSGIIRISGYIHTSRAIKRTILRLTKRYPNQKKKSP